MVAGSNPVEPIFKIMKFMHVGDTHVGSVYKSEQRNEDIKDIFKQIIDGAIERKVDFIVHSGDLFNEGTPQLSALLFVTDQLNRLKQSGIKMFIVPGSHDVGIGEEDSILELFDRNGLLVNLNSRRYIKDGEGGFILNGETYRNAFVCGVKGKRSKVEDEIFKRLKVNVDEGAWVKIFVFHHTISYLGEKFKDLDTESLPKGFDYYAAGHWHGNMDSIHYDGGIIQYPGSSEYCDEKEIVDNPNRGCYVVSYDKEGINSVDRVILKTRDKEIFEVSADGKSAAEIEKEVMSKLSKNEGKLLVIRIAGRMDGRKGNLGVAGMKNGAGELGYSYVSINTSKLVDDREKEVVIESKELDEIENEFLEKKEYAPWQIKMARYLIDAVGAGAETAKMRNELEEMFNEHDNKRD